MHPHRSLFVLALAVGLPLMAAERPCAHTTYADVVALDQAFYNNRMGAFQAGGMVFALRRDVVSNEKRQNTENRPYGLAQQRLYDLLFQTASATLLTLASDPKRLGAQVGFTAILHTWG